MSTTPIEPPQPDSGVPGGGQQGVNAATPQENLDPDARSRIAAGVFALTLGWAGVHRFYLGYTAIGIAQISVTIITFGIGWIWAIIEGILILTRDRRFLTDATGRPLRD
ncbi:TM2 domain-containing protein [Bifidobacterium mongoliense]|uniref:TM2 domain-containing protein n=1 Tax=Bifidobacterium mongoliense TaxID=518643 RepID=UPI002649F8CE|nr:TM2 domain-containing protein [Bifidobacterium mongoliense]MDN5633634.1 TM2 domain-containing protein [Bifidobacterium mongoliense]